jgi:hypothetical protein
MCGNHRDATTSVKERPTRGFLRQFIGAGQHWDEQINIAVDGLVAFPVIGLGVQVVVVAVPRGRPILLLGGFRVPRRTLEGVLRPHSPALRFAERKASRSTASVPTTSGPGSRDRSSTNPRLFYLRSGRKGADEKADQGQGRFPKKFYPVPTLARWPRAVARPRLPQTRTCTH